MSTNYEYIIGTENEYEINRNLIEKNLKTVSNYTGSDKLAKETHFVLSAVRNVFLSCITNVEQKINKKSNITSQTVSNLRNYIARFQQMKDGMKVKLAEAKKQIDELNKKINDGNNQIQIWNNTSDKSIFDSGLREKLIDFQNNQRPEYKKQLDNAKKAIPVLEKQINSTKDITRDIKFEALNSFGEASIKTLNNCIINFIRTFNLQVDAWEVVLGKKEKHKDNILKKVFTLNASRLKSIKTNLTSTKNKADVGYWFDKWKKFATSKNILETQAQNLDLTEYDLFLDMEIQNLKNALDKTTNEFKNAEKLDYENSKKIITSFSTEVQNFRTYLFDYIYKKMKTPCSMDIKNSLFKLALIRCSTEMYTNVENENFTNLRCVSQAIDVAKEKVAQRIDNTWISGFVGIGGLGVFGLATLAWPVIAAVITLFSGFCLFPPIAIPVLILDCVALASIPFCIAMGWVVQTPRILSAKQYTKIPKNNLNLNKQELKQIKQLDKNKEKQQKLEQNNKQKVHSKIFNSKKIKI